MLSFSTCDTCDTVRGTGYFRFIAYSTFMHGFEEISQHLHAHSSSGGNTDRRTVRIAYYSKMRVTSPRPDCAYLMQQPSDQLFHIYQVYRIVILICSEENRATKSSNFSASQRNARNIWNQHQHTYYTYNIICRNNIFKSVRDAVLHTLKGPPKVYPGIYYISILRSTRYVIYRDIHNIMI